MQTLNAGKNGARKIKKPHCYAASLHMAQEQGFEPWHRVTDLQAFQACPFNHLGIPARVSKVILIFDAF